MTTESIAMISRLRALLGEAMNYLEGLQIADDIEFAVGDADVYLESLNDTPPRSVADSGGEQTRPSSAGGVSPKCAREEWPERLMLRDTKLHDDLGGLGQRIFTAAGAGYEKREYVRADLAQSPWQPISTAPKDETRILLLYANGRCVCGNWSNDVYAKKPRPYWSNDIQHLRGTREAREFPPNHWMPLPPLPAAESEDAR